MKYRIEYISTFQADLLSVADFLAEYPSKASRIFAKLDKTLGHLSEMPEMYPIYQAAPNFHFIVVEDFLVFYKVKNQDRIVEIHRLLYGRKDIPMHIQD